MKNQGPKATLLILLEDADTFFWKAYGKNKVSFY